MLAEDAPRSTRFAARDLQTYIEKMTGAKLAVLSSPSGKGLVKLFVGESEGTRSLNLSTKGLEHGAYQLVSGSDWLAFLGDDTDFVPKEPWAKNNGDRVTGKDQREWEQASGTSFGVPNGGMYKNRERMPADLSREQDERYWNFDERGSFNAVCGFLKQLGVRWYLPGELGEVVPKRDVIALPKLDTIVKPDFPLRQFSVRFGTASAPTTKWMMRLGTRNPYGLMIAHGMHTMTHNEHTLKNHPDWFALYGGKRAIKRGERLNHLCYSNPELFKATVQWARAQVLNKNGPAAEADLQTALAVTSDKRLRSSIIANLGHNRETNLKDEASALIAYRQNFIGKERIGGADEFRSVQQAARILSRQGKHDDALQTLAHIDLDKTNGSWLATTLAFKGDLLVAAKRPDEARVSYRKALAEASLPASVRKVVNISLAELIK